MNRTRSLIPTRAVIVIAALVCLVATTSAQPHPGDKALTGEALWSFDTDWDTRHVETADLTGDGIPDIIVGESNGTYYGYPQSVYAINGSTGSQIWSYTLQDAVRSMTIGDITNDGIPDVIAGASYHSSQTPDGQIHAIDGETGLALWTYPVGATITSVAVGKIDGDAYADVAAGSFDDNVYAINGSTGGLLWNTPIASLWVNDVAIADVNSDGFGDVAYAHEYLAGFDNHLGVLDGTDGSEIWGLIVPYIVNDVLISDIDDDGTLETIFSGITGADQGYIYVRAAATGEFEWEYNLGAIDHTNGVINLFEYDVDSNGDPDLVVGNHLGFYQIFVFDGDTAAVMSASEPLDGFPEKIAFGDVTGDGELDMIAATYDRIQVLGATDGKKIWYFSVAGSIDNVAVGDFNDDGILDVAAAGGAEHVGTPPNPLKGVWAVTTAESPLLWEHLLDQYGNALTIAELNGDIHEDIVAVTSVDDRAVAISGSNGSELWTWTGTQNLYAVNHGDLNNDGQMDIVVAGNDDMVTALRGNDGLVLWQFTDPTDQIYRKCLHTTDLNNDGNDDVVVGCDNGTVYAINGSTGGAIWSTPGLGTVNDVDLVQVNDVGPLDVVVGTSTSKIWVLDGEGGGVIWDYTAAGGIEHTEAFDANGDKVIDVAAARSSEVIMIDGATQTLMWSVPMSIATNVHSMAHGDLDGDDLPDLVVPGNSTDRSVHALKGTNAVSLWSYLTGGEINTVWVEDMDGDGFNDVVAGSDDQSVTVINGTNGLEYFSFPTSDDVMHLAVGAIVGEGERCIAAVTFGGDGTVYAFDSFFEPGCCNLRGDMDASGSVNVSDLTYLVDFLFRAGPPPVCDEEGDVDGTGSINVSDLTYLVDFLFRSGPAPLPC